MWMPEALDPDISLYRAIAERLRVDMASGALKPGARLPTVRNLAYDMGINMGTVYRAYTLAEQQGLVSKELGRGTFVRDVTGDGQALGAQSTEAVETGPVDLTRNEPPFVPLDAMLRQSLADIARDSPLDGMLEYGHSQGLARHREILARWMHQSQGFDADPDRLVITGGAQQGLTIALGALCNPGDTILVEELSYPGVRNLARFFGLNLKPVQLDEQGILPEDLDRVCGESGARVLYCMPHAQNPTTATMGAERRTQIAAVAQQHDLMVIEDDVNAHDDHNGTSGPDCWAPLASEMPDRVVYISSLSKIIAPGLRVGMITAPPSLFDEVLAASQTTSWMAPPLMAELASLWIRNGTARDLVIHRSAITAKLQQTAAEVLAEIPYRWHPANTHLWVPLPPPWSSREFVETAQARGVQVSPSTQFAIDPATVKPGIRACLSEMPEARLREALGTITELYFEPPRPQSFRM
ncbi:MAG: PLP-dependent aminotransferase family protein [Rhodospirillales bacterium]|jgi:DNA-binding transcriptional MocR family regulator|nr:PLP-dependent aminotransferase family protein [Rhodospirillales bacterium]MBT4040174.1 PLP-dependent aminotransferase family protein [Rhodospirillales bacterium]MBT4628542.1 PLP-dependent aminotransferase family protein [Rhodospirillales bacterium]MBT5521694.1 PLP-dependent aminotransferase family protein [Rhodospirillales bacterium]MBT7780190.1 PLP-dependent aminotransferase family protein [Rhodospirillales bacterium]